MGQNLSSYVSHPHPLYPLNTPFPVLSRTIAMFKFVSLVLVALAAVSAVNGSPAPPPPAPTGPVPPPPPPVKVSLSTSPLFFIYPQTLPRPFLHPSTTELKPTPTDSKHMFRVISIISSPRFQRYLVQSERQPRCLW